ncbi:Radical SAM domain protein [Clostridium sp. DL-VIII]|uniref:radical SAM protein n=1 Tax=Clostridium sp. DL-VIII TaxID=641107 RepID=UPI00023AF3C2|nr:radical SAM protein [Clostridium sp. DL-VIII]EHI97195.1 Radical SAM domain protein [Clostridium sp. DL-VIII]
MSIEKENLKKEIELAQKLFNEGINADPELFKGLDFENVYLEQVHACFEFNHKIHLESKIPAGFRLPSGYYNGFIWDPKSRYSITLEEEKYYLNENGTRLYEIFFEKKPKFYNKHTSDGTKMSTIAQFNGSGRISVTYSNECALKDKGLDCLFCNINATKNTYAEAENIKWKNAKQIAETVKAAYEEGFKHVTITGGFVPERREVDYYIDVAEAIKEETGLEDFNGTACIGAPLDLSTIDKYKEAGYRTIATNMEIWDENIFKTICPGKEQICGGRQNWIDALKHEVEVFGKGRVRSYFVAGIEPKTKILEGIEYLASIGVIAVPLPWNPNPGSALEGHRSPTTEWHQDLQLKGYNILKKYGFTHDQFFDANNGEFIYDHYYDLDGDFLSEDRK